MRIHCRDRGLLAGLHEGVVCDGPGGEDSGHLSRDGSLGFAGDTNLFAYNYREPGVQQTCLVVFGGVIRDPGHWYWFTG